MSALAINAWLQRNGSYSEGLELLRPHLDADDVRLFMLELGETSVSRELLTNALQEIKSKAVRESVAVVDHVAVRPTRHSEEERQRMLAAEGDGFAIEELPPQLSELRQQAVHDLKERDYRRARLETIPKDADRLKEALRIVELDEAITAAYQRLDAWKETGVNAEVEPVRPNAQRVLDLVRQRKNIESYIARHNSGARTVSEEKLNGWKSRVAELTKEINALHA